MLKISALKLVDRLIAPIVLVFGTKYIAVLAINLVFDFHWDMGFSSQQVFSLPFINYSNAADLVFTNTLSSFLMVIVLALGFTFILLRFQNFTKNRVKPKVASRLSKKSMEYLLIDEEEAFHQVLAWYVLSWVVFLLVLGEFLASSVSPIVLSFSLTVVFVLTVLSTIEAHKSLYEGTK
ncbi:MAG: hypothetical protein WD231_05775 [Candidatus Woykebacteria bacterium]